MQKIVQRIGYTSCNIAVYMLQWEKHPQQLHLNLRENVKLNVCEKHEKGKWV